MDHQHSNDRTVPFKHPYFLAIKLSFFNHMPPERIMEMLTTVPVHFNQDIGVFSSDTRKEITGYSTFVVRHFGLVPSEHIISADCTNLILSNRYHACLLEPAPWLSILVDSGMNHASFIPANRYNQLDFVFRQFQISHPDMKVNIQTEGVKSGLVTLI
ncbi:MAG TPA: hypothetical protein VE870_15825 [Bacteroidales bacterium]|nr:hypothetical protein [Bacteroidales bacterium]